MPRRICAVVLLRRLSADSIALVIGLVGLVLAIIAGIKANNGEDYKYPYSIEFVK